MTKKYTTVVLTNHGEIRDLGAGERVVGGDDTWAVNAFTCAVEDVPKLRSRTKKKYPVNSATLHACEFAIVEDRTHRATKQRRR